MKDAPVQDGVQVRTEAGGSPGGERSDILLRCLWRKRQQWESILDKAAAQAAYVTLEVPCPYLTPIGEFCMWRITHVNQCDINY